MSNKYIWDTRVSKTAFTLIYILMIYILIYTLIYIFNI